MERKILNVKVSYMEKDLKELREKRKQWFDQMEQKLQETYPKEEDRMFYCHSSEDRIVLSHALFWTMTQPQFFKGKIRKEKFFLLLRQYEEEMLDAFQGAGYHPRQVYDFVWGRHLLDAGHEDRPLSKLTKDILDELEVRR